MRIFVVTHKNFDDSKLPVGYEPIVVGHNKLNKNWISDDTGDNISDLNNWYCELTAQYWAWKNACNNNNIYGICHYRRYFMDYNYDSHNIWDDIITEEKVNQYLTDHDIIIPFLHAKLKNNATLYKNTPDNEQIYHWVIIRDIIHRCYPEYINAFNSVLYGKYKIAYNMFIAKGNYFSSYSKWIFGVLSEYDNEIEKRHLKHVPRIDGFLSEALLLVWVRKNIKDTRIKYLDVRNTESNGISSRYYENKIVYNIIRKLQSNYAFLTSYKYFYRHAKAITNKL